MTPAVGITTSLTMTPAVGITTPHTMTPAVGIITHPSVASTPINVHHSITTPSSGGVCRPGDTMQWREEHLILSQCGGVSNSSGGGVVVVRTPHP